ncbi:MAG TPA: hypothetical protein VKP65_07405, partial [Rhodothermales bacterium]|nr:hypothetical protein [Rhodothermales bacterium]
MLVLFLWTIPASAQSNIADFLTAESPVNLLSNGGFESGNPAYWAASGDGATWSFSEARTPSHSLALSGAGEAAWTMSEGVRNWVAGIPGGQNPEIVIGAYVQTDGVNTNPTNDDEKFQLVFEFFSDASQTTNVLGQPLVLDVPQDAASTDGWVALSSETLGAITLPGEQAAKSARVTFRKGANATGTVYLDDLFLRTAEGAEGWAGDWFNANVDAGDTWYYWWDNFSGGVDTWPETQPFIQTVTDEDAHSGTYSLKIEQNDPGASETVAVSDRVPVTEGEPVLVSYWVKTEGVPTPEEIGMGDNNIGITALWYDNLDGGAAGWGEIGGADIRLNGEYNAQVIPLAVQETSTGWTHYAFVVYPVEGAVGMELRLRYWHAFEGTTFWDDVFIAPVSDLLAAVPELNLLSNGGFESGNPAYWAASGDGATWSFSEARTP